MNAFLRSLGAVPALLLPLFLACSGNPSSSSVTDPGDDDTQGAVATLSVAFPGNAYLTTLPSGASEVITSTGLANWTNPNTVASVYFRVMQPGTLNLSLVSALKGSSTSTVRVRTLGQSFNVNMTATNTQKTWTIGTVNVATAGYVRVDLQGVTKNGGYFGDPTALKVSGTASTGLVYANDAANYYWSRRGPSVHMTYTTPSQTEYFYNEVTVPAGQDPIGSYFMVNGFGEGYCGIQVKSPTERWILFSVWDPSSGKTTLVRKGPGVVDNAFGGEGTGGQSYLVFPWVAGRTYSFLTKATPDGAGSTLYSAWFYAPETAAWRFMATWKRPNTTTFLTGNHSFLENFIDTRGYYGRRVLFGNQWALSTSGTWTECTTGRFTGDATASNRQRLDFAGGLENGQFFLRNGGFFNEMVTLNQSFTRPATGRRPTVDVTQLP